MHTMWKGTISFGLVNIPVRLHTATEDKDISFRTLHSVCQAPIKYEKVCSHCGKEVPKEELVKAFEYAKGKFVVMTEEELKELEKEKADKSVEIIDFVRIEEIDPIYFNKSYYLSPNEGGYKAYSLLRKALQETGKVGIAKITIRSKEQMAVVRVLENTLLMETIHYPDEVRQATDVPNVPSGEEIVQKELDTAILLIDQLTTAFDPKKYHDEYREAVQKLIDEKRAKHMVVSATDKGVKAANVTDLMAMLQASLDQTKKPAKRTRKKTVTQERKKA
ncbi:MAG: Ku protein [Bacillus sp. (in: firmicutes)]